MLSSNVKLPTRKEVKVKQRGLEARTRRLTLSKREVCHD
jgi:hypothetical protein